MSKAKKGDRVGAILCADDKGLDLLGYGVYEGDHEPGPEAQGLAEFVRLMKRKNPRIRLDNGDVVWGCECWWGPEEEVKGRVAAAVAAGQKVLTVRISEARK